MTEQKEDLPLQRAFLRRSHAELQRTNCPTPPASNSKPREQRLAGAGSQPVCLGADVWERNSLVRGTMGVKANRRFEKQGACLS